MPSGAIHTAVKLGALLSPSVSMVLYSVVGWLDCRPSQSACVSCSAFVVLQDFSPQLRIRMCTGEPVALHVSANNRVCVPSSHGGPISRVLCRLRSVFAHPSSCHPAPLRPMHPNRPCYGRAVCTCEYTTSCVDAALHGFVAHGGGYVPTTFFS